MLSRMNLRNKILIPIGLLVLVVSCISIGMVVVLVDNIFRKNAITLSQESARRLGAEVRGELEKAASAVQTLATVLEESEIGGSPDGPMAAVLPEALHRTTGVSALWIYETAPDPAEKTHPTPVLTGWLRFPGEIRKLPLTDFPDQIRLVEDALMRSDGAIVLTEPSSFPHAGPNELFVQVIAPVRIHGRIPAAVGAVIPVEGFSPLFADIKPFGFGFGFLVSNMGTIAGHPRKSLAGRPVDVLLQSDRARPLKTAIRSGQPHVVFSDELGSDSGIAYVVFIPFSLREAAPWSAAVAVPEAAVMADTRTIGYRAAGIGSVSILVLILVIFSLSRRIVRPLYTLVDVSKSLAGGDFSRRANLASDDEFGMAGRYIDKAFDIVIDKMFWYEGMMDAIPFPVSVTDLNLRWTFINRAAEEALHAERNQVAGQSCREWRHQFCAPDHCSVDLLRQGKSTSTFSVPEKNRHYQIDAAWLHNAKGERTGHVEIIQDISEATRLKQKADERNWVRSGEVELNDIMRGEVGLAKLGGDLISFICRYLEAFVGVFFVMDASENALKLQGSYGYRRRKQLSERFAPGEGIIGQAALEKNTILLTDVPPDHLVIDSGIGVSEPIAVVAVPCVFEDQVKAVLELGAFHGFTDLQLAFLENIAVQIGVVVNTAESRHELRRLLEQTQEQAEILRQQQETLKRTNEELETQTRALRASEADLQSQQEELRVTNEELEERTRALEIQRDEIRKKNKELEQARREIERKAKDLEMASRYKSQFLANMSHELRTPLNSILILSQLLARNSENRLSEKQVEFASTIHSSGSDLLSLINEILDLSKVEAGKLDIVTEEVNLSELLDNVRRTFDPVAKQKRLALELRTDADVPEYMNTDAKRIWQILKNLMSNAFKFTDTGGVTLTVFRPGPEIRFRTSGLTEDNAVGFAVEDTGIGIPKEKQESVFSVFEQADGTTSRKYGGTGLGLSISREFARYMGGEIQLTSEPGRGSTFTLFLPESPDPGATRSAKRAAPAADRVPPPAPATENEKTPPPETWTAIKDDRRNIRENDRTILIIEDDPDFSKVLLELTRSRGFKGLIAEDGETGLHFADFYTPAAIILDVGLPGMDGWEVMRRLKTNADTRHIPVHFISAMDRPLEAMKMGAVGFIVKPASMESLENAFRRIEEKALAPVKKLLIVEDDETQITSIRELLGDGDLEITSAGTAREALSRMNEARFDCIILDLGLTDASGADLPAEIKKHPEWSTIPIIVYTGKSLTPEEEDRLHRYADSIIVKGVRSMERLLDETTLFLHRVESDLPDASRTILSMFHDKDATLRDKKILVVDDDMRNVFALASVLEQKGAVLVEARNGKECLAKLAEHPDTDLVIMDIMMPEMDGYEAMEKIRADRRFRDLKIIALTAKAMKGDKQKCIEAGANDYIAKPVDTDKLMSLLRVWLY